MLRGKLVLTGERGFSAYEIAVKHGFIGTEDEWLASLSADKTLSITQDINQGSSNATIPSSKCVYDFVKAIELRILEAENPLGHIRIETQNVNPEIYLGIGKWEYWGSGRVPVGVNTQDPDFNTVEKIGGEKKHILSVKEIPSHSHTVKEHGHSINLTTSSDGLHIHDVGHNDLASHNKACINPGYYDGIRIARTNEKVDNAPMKAYPSGEHTHNVSGNTSGESPGTSDTGGSQEHNNLQPYITCYMWKRVA